MLKGKVINLACGNWRGHGPFQRDKYNNPPNLMVTLKKRRCARVWEQRWYVQMWLVHTVAVLLTAKKTPSNPGDIWSVSPHACRANNGRIKTWRYIKKTTTKKHAKPMLQHTTWWHKWPIATEQSVRPFVWQFLINSKTHKPKLNQS